MYLFPALWVKGSILPGVKGVIQGARLRIVNKTEIRWIRWYIDTKHTAEKIEHRDYSGSEPSPAIGDFITSNDLSLRRPIIYTDMNSQCYFVHRHRNNWFFPNCFHWIHSIQWQKYLSLKGLKPATSCVRFKDAIKVPARHMWAKGSLNWLQFILQWFIRFREFTEFNANSAPFRKKSNAWHNNAHRLIGTPCLTIIVSNIIWIDFRTSFTRNLSKVKFTHRLTNNGLKLDSLHFFTRTERLDQPLYIITLWESMWRILVSKALL